VGGIGHGRRAGVMTRVAPRATQENTREVLPVTWTRRWGSLVGDRNREDREPYLPFDYALYESVRELVVLRHEDGSEVAAYSADGADPREVGRAV
jgi:hypothetical protein